MKIVKSVVGIFSFLYAAISVPFLVVVEAICKYDGESVSNGVVTLSY